MSKYFSKLTNTRVAKFFFIFFTAFFMLQATITKAADYLDTQYGPDGLEVHLLKASVANNVLTIAFMIENTGSEKIEMMSLAVADTAYTTSDKKYPVLKDSEDKWLASTITYAKFDGGFIFTDLPSTNSRIAIDAGGKKVGWVKFEAPGDGEWPVEVSLPGVSPFTIDNPNG